MALELLKGTLGVVGLAVAWLWIQRAWRRTFPAADGDDDALAGRAGCRGCTCGGDRASCTRERGGTVARGRAWPRRDSQASR